jgi:hypothetical protein
MRLNLPAFVRSRAAMLLVGVLLVLSGASLATAQDSVSNDLRINQVAHFGGDAIYCVDENIVATTSYPVATTVGGFRLLNSLGQELWFIPAEDLQAAINESVTTGKGVLVGQGQGTYGLATLFTYFDGTSQAFVFSGYDEYGKPNSLTYNLCTPDRPLPQPEGSVEELCTLVELLPKRLHKVFSPVFEPMPISETQVPCDTCPPFPTSKLAYKFGDRVSASFIPFCEEVGNPNIG